MILLAAKKYMNCPRQRASNGNPQKYKGTRQKTWLPTRWPLTSGASRDLSYPARTWFAPVPNLYTGKKLRGGGAKWKRGTNGGVLQDERPALSAGIRRQVGIKVHQATHLGARKPAGLLWPRCYISQLGNLAKFIMPRCAIMYKWTPNKEEKLLGTLCRGNHPMWTA